MGRQCTTLAAHSDFRDVAEFLLLDRGADPNAAAGLGFNALHNAIMQRDEMLVASLLAHGADPNAIRTWTPNSWSASDYSFGPKLVGAILLACCAIYRNSGIMEPPGFSTRPILWWYTRSIILSRIERRAISPQFEETTALMAAEAWVADTLDHPPMSAKSLRHSPRSK